MSPNPGKLWKSIKITKVINNIYNIGDIADDIWRYIFTALRKKPSVNECEIQLKISLMSDAIKLIIRIFMNSALSRNRPEIGQEKYGMVEDTGDKERVIFSQNIL